MILNVQDLTVVYPKSHHAAVDHVSFTVEEGSITCMIGPNGSGKSTVIKSILGLIPYQGQITVFDQPVSKAYGLLGFLPQRFGFDATFPITVSEFLNLALCNQESTNHHSKLINNTLELVGARNLANHSLSTLSGGQLQRILLARALVREPKLLILDEPEAGVDVGGEETFYELLAHLTKEHKLTVLIASHELDVVYAYADQVICINHNLVCRGAPKDVLDQNTFIKLFGRGLKLYGRDLHSHHQHAH